MRKALLYSLALFAAGPLAAQEPTEASSKVTAVTVYLQNAQVTREATVQVTKGDNIIKFSGLETGIDASSIQAAAPDMVLLNSVRHEVNYLKDLSQSPEMRMLEDSLRITDEAIARNKSESTVYAQELAMIQANQSIGSQEKGLSVDALIRMADFFRTRVSAIQAEQFKLSLALRKLEQTRARLQAQIAPMQARLNQPSNDIVVTLKSDYARSVVIGLRYVVAGASWTPAYDLRATDLTKPIRLDYRADVRQATGIDWKGVYLTLSTGNPLKGGTKPVLSQWNLYTYAGYPKGTASGYYRDDAERTMTLGTISTEDIEASGGLTLANYTQVREGAVTTEFKISVPQSIAADGKDQKVFIQSSDLPAAFHHLAVPKMDKDAFLLAAVTGWEGLNLLPGSVNIFFEGTFVSRAMLDPATATSDTLNFSLGRDPKVVVTRETLKDRSSQRTIGTNRERTFAYEITLRNTKSTAVNLHLQDQVPVSQDAAVIVKVEEISGAEHNTDTGILTWRMALQPNETKKVRLVYTIKYPKNKVVNGI